MMSEIFGRLGGPRDDEDEAVGDSAGALPVGPAAGRWLRRHIAGGIAALTTIVDGSYRASTITAVMVASLNPFQILISLELDSQMESWVRRSGVFAISLMSYEQQFLADQFAGMAPLAASHFQGIDHHVALTGAPVLDRSIGWADCRIQAEYATGDHTCFLGQVVAAGVGEGHMEQPLIYYLSRYARLR